MLCLHVLPALSIRTFLKPHSCNPGEFVLGVVVDYPKPKSLQPMMSARMPLLRLRELACMSERFQIFRSKSMPSTKPDDGVVLQNGEKVTLYFDVKLGKEGQPKTRDMFTFWSFY